MWINLKAPVGNLPAGLTEVADEAVARGYIAAGLATDGGKGPEDALLAQARSSMKEFVTEVTSAVSTEIQAATATLKRGGIRVDPLEQQDDKTRSIGDYVRCLVMARDPEPANQDGRDGDTVRAEAFDRLTKVYRGRPSNAMGRGVPVQRVQGEGQGATGGFMTPAAYEAMILAEAAEDSVFVPWAKTVPLSARTTYWPALDQYKVPTAGQSAFFGGVQIYRKSENVQRTYTQAGFKGVGLNAKDLTAFVPISRDLIYDTSISIDGYVTGLIGGAINWREEWEAFNGTGSGQMLGFYNAPSTIFVTRNTGSTIKTVDVLTMMSRLLPASVKNAAWLVHPYTMPYLQQLVDPAGHYLMIPYPVVGDKASLGERPTWQLQGIPILTTEKAGVPGTTNDLSLSDRTKYLLGRRGGLEIGMSTEFLFDTDEIAIRAKLRNDGAPQLIKPLTLADGSSQVSCNVVLN